MTTLVFLDANAADSAWLDVIRRHLAPYASHGLQAWDRNDIPPGARTKEAVQTALAEAKAAILLVSPYFLAEDFAIGSELHGSLSCAVTRGLRVFWLPVSASAFVVTDICEYQPLHDTRRPLDSLSKAELASALVDVCDRVRNLMLPQQGSSARVLPPVPPIEDLYIGTLPGASGEQSRTLIQLTKAVRQRDALRTQGADTTAVDARVHQLRRELRSGHPLHIGDTLSGDRYVLQQALGLGGFATVWLAEDRIERTQVALKVLHPQYVKDLDRRQRFLRGARAMHKLRHAAIVPILDPHEEDLGHLYFVMEYIAGETLEQAVLRGHITPVTGVPIVVQIGEALAHAHSHGLLHRDVKPGNILLDRDNRPYLSDFDLVRVAESTGGTDAGGLGTVLFAAPELFDEAKHADARADVFGLGMTTVFVLSGKSPSRDVMRDEGRVIDGLPCSEAVRSVLKNAIAWRREERFDSIVAFCRALKGAWASESEAEPPPIPVPPLSTPPPPQPPVPNSEPTPRSVRIPTPVPGPTPGLEPAPEPVSPGATGGRRGWISTLAVLGLGAAGLAVYLLVHSGTGPVEDQKRLTTASTDPGTSDDSGATATTTHAAIAGTKVVTTDDTASIDPSTTGATTPPPPPPPPPVRDRRVAAQKACEHDLASFARKCSLADPAVGSGDILVVAVVVNGKTGKASLSGKSNATLFPAVLRCIAEKLEERTFSQFPGEALEFDRKLVLMPD